MRGHDCYDSGMQDDEYTPIAQCGQMDAIYMIEAKGDYILIKCDDQNHTVHSTLKKIESKLPKDLFLKVHRSFIINIQRIVDIEDGSVLINRDVIPVSRSKKPELMERLNLL